MPEVKVAFYKSAHLRASFEGHVDPDGAEGYKFSGVIKGACMLDRSSTDFENTFALGHGGTSAEYTYKEVHPVGSEENTFRVDGSGVRLKNETVDFRIGINDGLSGQFSYGDKATLAPGGPGQDISISHSFSDDGTVAFTGVAHADGPEGYVLKGKLSGRMESPADWARSIHLGFKAGNGSWQYEKAATDADGRTGGVSMTTNLECVIRGRRGKDDGLTLIVGVTSGVFSVSRYSDETSVSLPLKF
ncbi:hypothetical protein [Streptomyces sp. NPDC058486]|uniref:hypothetical protein n=1 Tax=unclassified Streptomyces TaxID=2593676 RepID=UPI0036617D3C